MNKLLGKMKRLKKSMQNVAVEMEYYGGFNSKMISHSAQLSGAARILQTWIDGIKEDARKARKK